MSQQLPNQQLLYSEERTTNEQPTFLSNRERRLALQQNNARNRRSNAVAIARFSAHAQLRTAQRGLSPEDISYILHYGECYHAAAAIFYLLLSKNIPAADYQHVSRLIGTAVVVDQSHSTILTIWRNRRHGMRNIRRKLAAL